MAGTWNTGLILDFRGIRPPGRVNSCSPGAAPSAPSLPVPCQSPFLRGQVPLLRHRGEGELPVLRRDVLQEGGRLGERGRQEGGEQAGRGLLAEVQARDAAAGVPERQGPESAGQPARGEGDRTHHAPLSDTQRHRDGKHVHSTS